MLGVSKEMDLIMNSLAVPRKAKQAIGGITKLKKKDNPDQVRYVKPKKSISDDLFTLSFALRTNEITTSFLMVYTNMNDTISAEQKKMKQNNLLRCRLP